MSILQRLEQIKLDMPKLFNTRGKRRQLLQDEMIQWIDSIKRMYINEIDHLDGQIEYKQETINRLSAEIDWENTSSAVRKTYPNLKLSMRKSKGRHARMEVQIPQICENMLLCRSVSLSYSLTIIILNRDTQTSLFVVARH